jgi:hypothetical protein
MTTDVSVDIVATNDPITVLVLREFRLRAVEDAVAAARIVAASPPGIEPSIPLLTSHRGRRDVATVRALHAARAHRELRRGPDRGERSFRLAASAK